MGIISNPYSNHGYGSSLAQKIPRNLTKFVVPSAWTAEVQNSMWLWVGRFVFCDLRSCSTCLRPLKRVIFLKIYIVTKNFVAFHGFFKRLITKNKKCTYLITNLPNWQLELSRHTKRVIPLLVQNFMQNTGSTPCPCCRFPRDGREWSSRVWLDRGRTPIDIVGHRYF